MIEKKVRFFVDRLREEPGLANWFRKTLSRDIDGTPLKQDSLDGFHLVSTESVSLSDFEETDDQKQQSQDS